MTSPSNVLRPRSLAVALLWLAGLARAAAACPPLPAVEAARLGLDEALARVAPCHPDVLAARAAAAAADADRLTAAQQPNPQFSVGAQSLAPGMIGAGNLWSKGFDHQLRLDQQVERGGKPALRRATADALHAAARADWADTLRQARLAVARNWIDLWAARARRTQLEAAVALNAESLAALERRVRAGDAAPLDATRFRLDDARARADLHQAEADIRTLARQLALALDAGDDAVEALARDAPAFEPPAAMPAAAAAAAAERADVVAARSRVDAAERSREVALALAVRDVGVGVQFDRYPVRQANPNGTGANHSVSLSLSVPLFVRHAYEGEAARAQADLDAARQAWRRALEAARADVARAQAQAASALERRRLVAERLVPDAEAVAAGAELAYRRGASSALEVIDARRNLRAVRLERVAADADWAKARAELLAAGAALDPTDTR